MKPIVYKEWMINGLGMCIVAPTPFWAKCASQGLNDKQRFRPVKLYSENKDAPEGHYLIHRPSGGLGDIICILPAIKQFLTRKAYERIVLAFPELYHWLINQIIEDLPEDKRAKVTLTDFKTLHLAGFWDVIALFREQYLLWCPAGMHENETMYKPTECRLENYTKLFGFSVIEPEVKIPNIK